MQSLQELPLSGIGFGPSLIGLFEVADHLIVAFLGHFSEVDHFIVVAGCLVSQGLRFTQQLFQLLSLPKLLSSSTELRLQGSNFVDQLLLFVRA